MEKASLEESAEASIVLSSLFGVPCSVAMRCANERVVSSFTTKDVGWPFSGKNLCMSKLYGWLDGKGIPSFLVDF